MNQVEIEKRVGGERLLEIENCPHNFIYMGIVICGMQTCNVYWCPKCGKEVERCKEVVK